MNWQKALASTLLLLSAGLSLASACPFCESETGVQVHAGIFNDQFWSNVTLIVLPFPILLGMVALIYFDISWPWTKSPVSSRVYEPVTRPLNGD